MVISFSIITVCPSPFIIVLCTALMSLLFVFSCSENGRRKQRLCGGFHLPIEVVRWSRCHPLHSRYVLPPHRTSPYVSSLSSTELRSRSIRLSVDKFYLIIFNSGVHLKNKGDDKGQQYLPPSKLVEEKKVDVLIVGRGIVESPDPVETARLYAEEGYKGYLSVTNQLHCWFSRRSFFWSYY